MSIQFNVNKFIMTKRGHCAFNLLLSVISFGIPMIASIFEVELTSLASYSFNGLGGTFAFASAWFAFQKEDPQGKDEDENSKP